MLIKFRQPIARVAFSMRPARGPWGGSSHFVTQFANFLKRRGYEISFELKGDIDLILLIDPRVDNRLKLFGPAEIAAYRRTHPHVRVVHRINECDQRKGSTDMDALLCDASEVVDYTVFISSWLRDYHAQRWFDASRPHCVIYNGADPAIFHPIGNHPPLPGENIRLVTHHWSDNPLKGFDVYQAVDLLLSEGQLPGFELWVIGRWPHGMEWKSARTFPPLAGRFLANKLRACHLYLTASRWEPCGMHHIEGAQCGLPLIYHEDGGGIVEAGEKYGIGFRDDIRGALQAGRERLGELKGKLLHELPCGDRMVLDYANVIQRLIANATPSL